MSKFYGFFLVFASLLLLAPQASAQKPDLKQVVAGKWKVIWYADDGKEINMEAKKQQLVLKSDGSGKMSMMGEDVGEVVWSVVDKKHINFQDDPGSQPYLVKVSKYKSGRNMLFTGTMPTGTVRQVYFEALSSKKE